MNAGATEVAKTFLTVVEQGGLPPQSLKLEAPDSQPLETAAIEMELKTVLVEFLKRSKCLLERARKVLGTGSDKNTRSSITNSTDDATSDSVDGNEPLPNHNSTGSNGSVASSPNQPPPPPDSPQTKMENHHLIWQKEMDRGYDVLLETIFPYIRDVVKNEEEITSAPAE